MDLIGLTNAMTDILIKVKYSDINKLGLKKGYYNPFPDFQTLNEILTKKEKILVPAGSPANVAFTAKKIGLETGLIGTLGNDIAGINYADYLKKININTPLTIEDGLSGVCYVLITPDGEKTSFASIGVSGHYDIYFKPYEKTKVFHTSGYELLTNTLATIKIMSEYKQNGAKISFDMADPIVCMKKRKEFLEISSLIDILFMTQGEANALYQSNEDDHNLEQASKEHPIAILKKGKDGVSIRCKDECFEIPSYTKKIVNTNGAGDAFAAGFLKGYINKRSLRYCGNLGSKTSAMICGMNASHL